MSKSTSESLPTALPIGRAALGGSNCEKSDLGLGLAVDDNERESFEHKPTNAGLVGKCRPRCWETSNASDGVIHCVSEPRRTAPRPRGIHRELLQRTAPASSRARAHQGVGFGQDAVGIMQGHLA